jgi:glycosyltransferase involved in cell wall biosynthesis
MTEKKIKVVHLSSSHFDHDVRIFLKECSSLSQYKENNEFVYDVHLVLSGVEPRVENNVTIHSINFHGNNRNKRLWKTVDFVFQKALELEGDIYHLHDPELLRIALKLKRKGKKVIYDSHEDLPRMVMGKSYIKLKPLVAGFLEFIENYIVKRIDGVVAATPHIRNRFIHVNKNTIDVNNFPLNSEIDFSEESQQRNINQVCFIGGISHIRGISQLIDAMSFTNCQAKISR